MILTPTVQPCANVVSLNDGVWQWDSKNDDPQFTLQGLDNVRGKWLQLEIEVRHESKLVTPAVIYIDTGAGFNEKETVAFYCNGAAARNILRLPRTMRALRFDPLAQKGRFSITHFSASVVSVPRKRLTYATIGHYAKRLVRAMAEAWRLQRRHGIKAFLRRLVTESGRLGQQGAAPNNYLHWQALFETVHMPALLEDMSKWALSPLISVVMPTYNTPEEWLIKAIESVQAQVYPHWELCIADDASSAPHVRQVLKRYAEKDARIRLVFREQNGHISQASNSALALASGEFVALLDHDDELHPLALYRVVEQVNQIPEAVLIYSDEDKIDELGRRYDPYFKCQLNYELLLAHNMISHLGVYRRSMLIALDGFRSGFEGAQDYDLALRVIERTSAQQIVHIPQVLYHWRAIQGSTALASSEKNYAAVAARRAISEHLQRVRVNGQVVPAPEAPSMNRVIFARPQQSPLVSILIPTRDRVDLLAMCINSILTRSTYSNFEIIIIDNASCEAETLAFFSRLPKEHVRLVRDESPFNFSALNNRAAGLARGEYLCLMNNDIEIITPDWIEEMLSFAVRPDIGAVGARLWYPNGRLQHGGVILGLGGVAGHAHKNLPRGEAGYFGRAVLHQAFSAVTAACLLVRASIYRQAGGLDESFAVAFNDIDFCLRVRALGYRNVWTPYAEMNHHESASRGEENSPEKKDRFNSEVARMWTRWGRSLLSDPTYSPCLSLDRDDFSIATRLPN